MKYISLDIETNGTKLDGGIIWMIGLGRGKKVQIIEDTNGITKLPKEIQQELEDPEVCKIVHSAVFDLSFLNYLLGCRVRNVWCTQTNEVVIQGMHVSFKKKALEDWQLTLLRKHSSKLEYTIPRYGFPVHNKSQVESFIGRPKGKKFDALDRDYLTNDVKYLGPIRDMQEHLLERDGLLEVALLENKTSEVLAGMCARGIGINSKLWKSIADDSEREFERRMKKLPGGINWNAPGQVKSFFADRGVIIPNFDDMYDIYLDTRDKLLGNFILARELHKAVTSYGNNWFQDGSIDGDGRVRCHAFQCNNTGRINLSDPNLSQLPGEDGKKKPKVRRVIKMIAGEVFTWAHRKAFQPAKGNVFVSGDFEGQEIGIMASAANEKLWIDAKLRGDDIHAMTAKLIRPQEWAAGTLKGCTFPKKCKCPQHLVMREPAKIQNFFLAYGGGADKLVDAMGQDIITRIEARMFIGAHKRVTPALTRYLEKNGSDAVKTGVAFSADPYQRRRVLRGEEAWEVRNQGKNTPIQSAGANMLKLAMISLPEKYPIVLVIHDQIIVEVPKAQAAKAQKALGEVMRQSADYITGIKGLIKVEPKIQLDISKL